MYARQDGRSHSKARRIVTPLPRGLGPAVSLGSVDSLIQHPASLTHHIVDPANRQAAGISDQMLRLSIGLEDVDDLWADLEQALIAATCSSI